MVAVFFLVGSVSNVLVFDLEPLGTVNIFNLVGMAIITVVVGASRPLVQGTSTVLFGVWLLAYLWSFVPRTY